VSSVEWGEEIASVYDDTSSAMFSASIVDPVVDALVALADGGRAPELAIGTGRIGLPLSERGVEVHGIELSPHMAARLQAKPGAERIELTVGDMTSARVEGTFSLVYLVFNTIMNVRTQEGQVEVFRNAADHLQPGGVFVLEVLVPQLRRVPVGEIGRIFQAEDDHLGYETFEDVVEQIAWSHHWMRVDGELVRHRDAYRYVWPAELDLMARIAGLRLRHRWSDWRATPFVGDAEAVDHVVVYEKPRD
jgi:SAM-dependent methyltransferase